jgi:hypothetical protein
MDEFHIRFSIAAIADIYPLRICRLKWLLIQRRLMRKKAFQSQFFWFTVKALPKIGHLKAKGYIIAPKLF